MGSEHDPALSLSSLTKTYRTGLFRKIERTALLNLDLQVLRGEIFGYLGPNGSGKTTTLKLIVGLVSPDAGSISVLGLPHADAEWRRRTGYLPEHPYFYDYLTPTEYLDYAARLSGVGKPERRDRGRALLEAVGLAGAAHLPMRRFSKGMLQRLGIAQALVHDPELVFLDEPMSGLDPLGRRLVRNIILGLKERGKTVFFSTHILPDAETLCDRVAVLRGGQLLKVGHLEEILQIDVAHMEVLVSGLAVADLDGLPPGIRARQPIGERWRLEVDESALGTVIRGVEERRGRVLSVQPIRQSLEDYFLREMAHDTEAGEWVVER